MAWENIKIPRSMTIENILGLARLIDYYAGRDEIRIAFDDDIFFAPFSMLFVAAKLKSVRDRNPSIKIELRNHQSYAYAAHMGFFKMFGADYGRDIGEAWGNDNYLPITCLDRESFYRDANDRYAELGDLIQREADKIAGVVTRGKTVGDPM